MRRIALAGIDPQRWLSLACAIAALLLAFASFQHGLSRGYHRWAPEPMEYENVKIAAAISNLYYRTDRGYVADIRVYNTLREGGLTQLPEYLGPLGVTHPENEQEPGLIDAALERAAHLGPLNRPYTLIKEMKPVEPNDLGMTDYYALAFRLFGLHVKSFYKLYYLLHFATIALFIWAWWRRADAMMLMVLVVAGHFFAQAFFHGTIPSDQLYQVSTPYNQRFISVLGVLPALHIALAVLNPPRLRASALLPLAAQAAILLFVWSTRNSAMWEILWPASLAAGFLALALGRYWRLLPRRLVPLGIPTLVSRGVAWPAVTLAAVVAVFFTVTTVKEDPVYRFSDEFIPHHLFWHSVYIGIAAHPEWPNTVPERFATLGTDAIPMASAQDWLKDKYDIDGSYIVSKVWGLRYRTAERVIREDYLDYIKSHPRIALEAHAIYKTHALATLYATWNSRTFAGWSASGKAALGAALALVVATAVVAGLAGVTIGAGVLATLVIGTAWAILPAYIIMPGLYTMSDQVLMINTTIIAAFLVGIGALARRISGAKRIACDAQ